MSRLTISTPPDFAFVPTITSHGWYVLSPFDWDATKGVLRRVENLDGNGSFDLRIRHDRGKLIVDADRDLTPVREALRARLRRMFQLEVDLSAFHLLCKRSKSHRDVARKRFGRLLCGSTLFEDAVKIIATTNTAWRQTVRMVELLTQLCGSQSQSGARAFPDAADIALFDAATLQSECRLGYRAAYVHSLSEGVASGRIDLERIADPSQATGELFKSYRALPGIGPYGSAHLLAMDGRHDFIAVDTEFRSFVRQQHFGGRDVSDREMLEVYEGWGKWKYLAYWSELWTGARGN